MILHANTIGGNITITGGGGGLNCNKLFEDITGNIIGGSVTVTDVNSCWMGIIRNTVTGNVTARSNVFADPDADEIVTNTIGKTLACSGNSPAPQLGDSGGSPNVAATKLGQCAGL